VRLHASHPPVQAPSQHTPSAQKPLWQSPGHAHACPFGVCIPPELAQLGALFPQPPHAIATAATAITTAGDQDGRSVTVPRFAMRLD
jgi:hypothetical protein